MMSCEAVREALVDLVFTELDDEACARLNEHLAGCTDCRRTERELLAMRDSVRGTPPALDAALERRVRAALVVARPAPRPFWRRRVPAHVVLTTSAACTVLTLLLTAPHPARGPARREGSVDATGVPIPAGNPVFNAAEPLATSVRGAGVPLGRRDSLR